MIQRTLPRIFNATSDWQSFDVALKKNQEIWAENQYTTERLLVLLLILQKTWSQSKKITSKNPKTKHSLKKNLTKMSN